MAVAITTVEARPRQAGSKGQARRVRRSGMVPAVVYGAKKEAAAISLDPKVITRILHSESGHNTIFDLQFDGEHTKAMIVDWQYEPIKGALMHVDLKRIAMDERLRVEVPIMLVGDPAGVKIEGGILEQTLREIEVECLPGDIPSHIDVDVSQLVFGQSVRVRDLPHAEGKLEFLTDEDQLVAHIVHVKEEAAPAPEEVAVEGAAATPAEPELIKKGKQETEEAPAEGGEKGKK